MDWQQILSLSIVACTAFLMAYRSVRKRKRPSSASPCGSCADCSMAKTAAKN